MKAHINNEINIEPLKHLLDLISEGNDAKILNFVKTTFALELPIYINEINKIPQLNNDVLQLKLNGLKRQVAYNEAIDKLNKMIEADEKRFGLK